ncbi:hypothetical protein CC1G_04784 [Coprinopsis cinerea okayama7|uniref:F-box domain-containing protein n=1 Tax=Coprinopsis cinerea (strain Okayama-7 / 130 / ATCC MYA-4618 / FGSC 9003) TaxID=240176 RepID=A8P2J9_COPC7|nr:hypothetical protein CC1G_04784 [Coprinopsis cinerea okayama7\|eukprot:XP_001838340.1 hypothetical protein CC1G_04784 [Coprinopsis cinerea okayama7\
MDATNTIRTPLLVSQICSRWRETALATPRLWSRLYLQFTSTSFNLTELVQTWLTRSGGCPLTIYVFWEEPPFTPSHPVLDALTAHSERWQSMFFYMPYHAFKSLAPIRKRLPLLTTLSLGTKDDPPPSSSLIGKLDMFSDAPLLRSLESVNISPLIFKFPWSHLRTIPMMAVSSDDFIDILLQTSHLEQGGFVFMDSGMMYGMGSVYSPHLRVQHNSLREVSIMTPPWNETVDLRGLFPQLTFPKLEFLQICNLRSPFSSEFTGFLSRLGCLQTLHLRKTALTDSQLIQGLKTIPTLTKLIVYSAPLQAPTVTHSLLSAMTWRPLLNVENGAANGGRRKPQRQRQNLLPALKSLELTIDYNVCDTFIEMVRSRVQFTSADSAGLNGGTPLSKDLPARLEKIRIRPTEDLGDRIYTALAEVASYGVEISVEDFC